MTTLSLILTEVQLLKFIRVRLISLPVAVNDSILIIPPTGANVTVAPSWISILPYNVPVIVTVTFFLIVSDL